MEERRSFMNEPGQLAEPTPDMDLDVHPERQRFPFCIVWTPLPLLSYVLPFIGHMGIATSAGVIRDFAAPYYVSEDDMAFGKPTKYWQLDSSKAKGGAQGWDAAISEASEIYKTKMHNICWNNCYSYTATALNLMLYDNSGNWNMLKLAFLVTLRGKYVSFSGFVKTWLPFSLLVLVITLLCLFV
ncbi:hypothetical protein KM043_001804 [Ampulex compressa]|nr:hypothetical protein KM043_001804 [Ampulex compressa]